MTVPSGCIDPNWFSPEQISKRFQEVYKHQLQHREEIPEILNKSKALEECKTKKAKVIFLINQGQSLEEILEKIPLSSVYVYKIMKEINQ